MANTKGLDTTDALSIDNVKTLKKLGIGFVIKYCANSTTFPNKRLTHAERALLVGQGIKSGFVFERGNTAPYFTAEQGKADAATVLAYFAELGVAKGVACFFAVDYDASAAEIAGPITAYATEFHNALKAAGYMTGVYGSGLCCSTLKKAGLVHWTWKAQSTGWSGYAYFGWNIRQGLGHVGNLASDPDEASEMGWAW